MKLVIKICFLLITAGSLCHAAKAQELKPLSNDSSKLNKNVPAINTAGNKPVKEYDPNVAVKRSLMVPGWGQATNKKYWKIPLVYGALGTTAYIFFNNIRQYKDARQAYILASDTIPGNDDQIKEPYYSVKDQPDRIRVFRNAVRQNIDYSVLFFIAFWGLNVADAAVDAHLKTFDVSDDLSLGIKAGYSPMANTNGVSIVLHIGK